MTPAAHIWATDEDAAAEVEWLELAARLASDGETERAAIALDRVDEKARAAAPARFQIIRGIVAAARDDHPTAADAFAEAIKLGGAEPAIYLQYANALMALERWADAARVLAEPAAGLSASEPAWRMRAHALWQAGDAQAALDALEAAQNKYPDDLEFSRRRVFYLIELGLLTEAADLGRRTLAAADASASAVDLAAVGSALARSGRSDEAMLFLEEAALRYPDHREISLALAQAYVARGDDLAAANLLARRAESEPALFAEAAELFRRAGQPARALALNGRVPDSSKRLRQRAGLLVDAKRFDEVVGLVPALQRAGLDDDEEIQYAVAYASFRQGDFAAAEHHLARLKSPELFRKATEIRRLIQECDGPVAACL